MIPLAYSDESPRSRVVPAAKALGIALASCVAFRLLAGDETVQAAQDRVVVGRTLDPWAGEAKAKLHELQQLRCRAYIRSPYDGILSAQRGAAIAGCPDADFRLWLRIRRQVLPDDVGANRDGMAGVYNAFWDLSTALAEELLEACQRESGDLGDVEAVELTSFGEARPAEGAGQGDHYWAEYEIDFNTPGDDS